MDSFRVPYLPLPGKYGAVNGSVLEVHSCILCARSVKERKTSSIHSVLCLVAEPVEQVHGRGS